MDVQRLFEDELRKRGLTFSIDSESKRHAVELGGGRLLVSLDNLKRDVAADGDVERVSRFVDAIVASTEGSDTELSADQLYWSLEPNDYEEPADFRVEISKRVDRALVHVSSDGRLITWVTSTMLRSLGLSEAEAGSKAFANLARVLSEATIESENIGEGRLGFINTSFPSKASLILAPNLREVAGPILGWPLLAVAPDRGFLYLWTAHHTIQKIGGVVVREYSQAPYPISTEVYEITDDQVRAIGEFPKPT